MSHSPHFFQSSIRASNRSEEWAGEPVSAVIYSRATSRSQSRCKKNNRKTTPRTHQTHKSDLAANNLPASAQILLADRAHSPSV